MNGASRFCEHQRSARGRELQGWRDGGVCYTSPRDRAFVVIDLVQCGARKIANFFCGCGDCARFVASSAKLP